MKTNQIISRILENITDYGQEFTDLFNYVDGEPLTSANFKRDLLDMVEVSKLLKYIVCDLSRNLDELNIRKNEMLKSSSQYAEYEKITNEWITNMCENNEKNVSLITHLLRFADFYQGCLDNKLEGEHVLIIYKRHLEILNSFLINHFYIKLLKLLNRYK